MQNIKYIVDNNKIRPLIVSGDYIQDKIPPALYTVEFTQSDGFFLTRSGDKFNIPNKIYGDYDNKTNKIITTWNSRTTNMGILLTGIKGAGKTMLMKNTANEMLKMGYPVILIKTGFAGNDFINFLDKLGECVILFDEFGKLFPTNLHRDEDNMQDSLLSLFDGTSDSHKKMLIITENDIHSINSYFIGRPGRIHYHLKYDRIPEIVVDDYLNDRGIPDDVILSIKDIYFKYSEFSFDILQNILEEYMLYKGNINELIEDLNIPLDDINTEYRLLEVSKLVNNTQDIIYQSSYGNEMILNSNKLNGRNYFNLYNDMLDWYNSNKIKINDNYKFMNDEDDDEDYTENPSPIKENYIASKTNSNSDLVENIIEYDDFDIDSSKDLKYSKHDVLIYNNKKYIFKIKKTQIKDIDYRNFFK